MSRDQQERERQKALLLRQIQQQRLDPTPAAAAGLRRPRQSTVAGTPCSTCVHGQWSAAASSRYGPFAIRAFAPLDKTQPRYLEHGVWPASCCSRPHRAKADFSRLGYVSRVRRQPPPGINIVVLSHQICPSARRPNHSPAAPLYHPFYSFRLSIITQKL